MLRLKILVQTDHVQFFPQNKIIFQIIYMYHLSIKQKQLNDRSFSIQNL